MGPGHCDNKSHPQVTSAGRLYLAAADIFYLTLTISCSLTFFPFSYFTCCVWFCSLPSLYRHFAFLLVVWHHGPAFLHPYQCLVHRVSISLVLCLILLPLWIDLSVCLFDGLFVFGDRISLCVPRCPRTGYVDQLALNLWQSLVPLLSSGTTDMHHHAWSLYYFSSTLWVGHSKAQLNEVHNRPCAWPALHQILLSVCFY